MSLERHSIVYLSSFVLVFACSPAERSSDSDAGTMEADGSSLCTMRQADVSGTVSLGGIGIGDAQVWLLEPGQTVGTNGECGQCSDNAGGARTAPNGSFTLRADEGTHDLLIRKGLFERRVSVQIPCGDQTLDAALTTLSGEGARPPRVAVVVGQFDPVESILEATGLFGAHASEDPVALLNHFPNMDPVAANTLRSIELLSQYDIVMIPCGAYLEGFQGADGFDVLDAPMVSALREFVESGGRLYVTDLSYDVVEQVFPRALTFAGGDPSSDVPEARDQAEIGLEGTPPTYIEDERLFGWLSANGITDGRSLALSGAEEARAVVSSVAPSTQVHLRARDGDPPEPLAVSFAVGCGRVVFSSVHLASGASTDLRTPNAALTLYLLLDLLECVQDVVLI